MGNIFVDYRIMSSKTANNILFTFHENLQSKKVIFGNHRFTISVGDVVVSP